MTTRRAFVALSATAVLAASAAGAADAYPSRTVRIVVAYAPGGAVDTVARKMAQKLTEQLGQQLVVENKPGATGTMGAREVARSDPNGYTLLAIDNTYAMLPYVFTKLPFDHAAALVPITISAFAPIMLTVSKDSQFNDLQALIAYAKQNPEQMTYGTGGNGSAPHFATEALQQAASIKLYHVPFKGAGEAVVGVMSGTVDLVMVSPPSVMGNIRAGQMRSLAISGTQRAAVLPDVPTFAEAGLPQYRVLNWSGLAAPNGTPEEIITKLQAEVAKALAAPDMKEFLDSQAAVPGGMAPDAFAQLMKEETERWREVAAGADIKRQ